MRKIIVVLCGFLAAAFAAQAATGVVANIQRAETELEENQVQFLPVSPPSEQLYIHKVNRALPVDFDGFDPVIRSQLYADLVEINSNCYPIYTVFVKEDPVSRDRVLYNVNGDEVWRKPAPVGYNPYAFMLNKFMVSSILEIDPFYRLIFDPSHIALELYLIPEEFFEFYSDDLDALTPDPEPEPEEPVVAARIKPRADKLEIQWPEGFEGLIDILATSDLQSGDWELAALGIITAGQTNFIFADPNPGGFDTRFFRLGDGSVDSDGDLLPNSQEIYVFKTDPNNPDMDGDGVFDGDEVNGTGNYGDMDGFVTDPFFADRVDFPLPAAAGNGPAADLSEFPAYTPPMGSPAVAGAPQVAEWTRINAPGDTMVMTGENFSGTELDNDTRVLFYGQNDRGRFIREGGVRRLDGREAAITLPENLPADSMYLLWVGNAEGYSSPVAINQTEAWWVGPEKLDGGELFSIYGRNLALGEDGKCHAYIEELDLWIESTNANPYKADFVMPAEADEGEYTVWAHNGSGAEYGWSDPLQLEIEDAIDWDAGSTVNVKDFGATGDGSSDDRDAIQAAIDGSEFGDTIYFPAGTYLLGDRVKAFSGRRLMGEGMDETTLSSHPNFSSGGQTSLLNNDNSSDWELRDMTVYAGDHLGDKKIYHCRSAYDIKVINVRFSQLDTPNRQDVVDAASSVRAQFIGCEFIAARNVFTGWARQISFRDCHWYGVYDCNVLLSNYGADEMSAVNCTAQHYEGTDVIDDGRGWGSGRWIWGTGHGGTQSKLYIANNQVLNMHPRFDPRFEKWEQELNTGEHIMFEWLATLYDGYVATADENSFTVEGDGFSDRIVVIVEGKGLGQSREIVDYDEGTGSMTIHKPWTVIPDSTSKVMAGNYANRIVVYDNFLDGDPRLLDTTPSNEPDATNVTATCGVSMYGGFQDTIVAKNEIQETRTGIYTWGLVKNEIDSESINNPQPNFFNQIMDNSIDKSYDGLKHQVGSFNDLPNSEGPSIAYNVWRRNKISRITNLAASYYNPHSENPIRMSVFQDNEAELFAYGISESDHVENQVWIGNVFDGAESSGAAVTFGNNSRPALIDNIWMNFDADYGGDVPGAVLETPLRVLDVLADEQILAVRNGGTEEMRWVAIEASPWLTLTTNETTLAAEILPADNASACGGLIENQDEVNFISFQIDTATASGFAPVLVVSDGGYRVLTISADGTISPASRTSELYDEEVAERVADEARIWAEHPDNTELFLKALPFDRFQIPDRSIGREFRLWSVWKLWRTFWRDKALAGVQYNYFRGFARNWRAVSAGGRCYCCLDWRKYEHGVDYSIPVDTEKYEFTLDPESDLENSPYAYTLNPDNELSLWEDWLQTWESWKRENGYDGFTGLEEADENVKAFKRYWSKRSNRNRYDCWKSWNNWVYWDAFWSDKSNWKKCKDWEDFQVSWSTYLIESKHDDVLRSKKDLLTGAP